jgi:hypothetical protein
MAPYPEKLSLGKSPRSVLYIEKEGTLADGSEDATPEEKSPATDQVELLVSGFKLPDPDGSHKKHCHVITSS